MIYLSAGHHLKDPGAVNAQGVKEADLTMELRDMIVKEIQRQGGQVSTDKDTETLGQYIARIKPGSGSVLCEIHFNASDNKTATGTECLHSDSSSLESVNLCKDIAEICSKSLGIKNRGAKSEAQSHRGRLGILHTAAGIACLPEICFISCPDDMRAYQNKKSQLVACIASVLVSYDNLNK